MMIIIILILILTLILCSLWEVSFSGLNIIRIKKMAENNDKRAIIVYDLSNKYSETITTILVINCICSISVSSVATYYFSKIYGDSCVWLVTLILTLVILIFGEIIPKILGREYSEYFALKFCKPLRFLVILLSPVSKIVGIFEKKIKNTHRVTATKEELVEIVKTIKDEGVIEESESIFIQKAVLLKKLRVQNVMVNRESVSYLYDTDSSLKVRECVFRDKHDRIPIITKDKKAVGILYEVDLLDEILTDGSISIKKNMKEPICVSRGMSLASCLEILNKSRAHMALVVDRDNTFLGIVTIEDIVNELMRS